MKNPSLSALKQTTLLSALVSAAVLTGCTIPPKDGLYLELPEPRPTTTESSYAMKVATEIQTTARCLGCKDTVLWQDEKALANNASFNARMITTDEYTAAREYRSLVSDLNKAGKLCPETLPPTPKVVLNENDCNPKNTTTSGGGLTSGMMIANSFDGRWTNPGSSLGVGLTLGFLFSSSPPDNDENRRFSPARYMKATFVLPEQIPFKKFNYAQLTPEENEKLNASCYGAAQFVRVMTKSAIDMGYKPIGDLRFSIYDKYAKKPHWGYVYQPLENDEIGCPKVTPDLDRIFMCRVEFGNYSKFNVRHTYTHFYEKNVVPIIFGGDRKTTRWIAHMGYHRDHPFGLIVDEAENLTDEDGDRNYRHAMGMQKYLKSGQFIYVPQYFLASKERTSQCVLDSNGVHYFAVIVPEDRPVPTAPADPVADSTTTEKSGGVSGWFSRLTNS